MATPQLAAGRPTSANGSQNVLGPSVSPTTASPSTAKATRKRKRSNARPSSSPGSGIKYEDVDLDDNDNSHRVASAKKTSCNECRQQKLGCDAQHNPFQPCSRCKRQGLECRFDANFKRIGKRARQVEIEQENDRLHRMVQELQSQVVALQSNQNGSQAMGGNTPILGNVRSTHLATPGVDAYQSPHEGAVESLLHLSQGIEGAGGYRAPANDQAAKRLGDLVLPSDKIRALFIEFFDKYHPFLPLLDPHLVPEEYFELSPLLFWTIISVACRQYPPEKKFLTLMARPFTELLQTTLAEVPQNYNVVKALCLLCTWPLPVSSTSKDPTLINCGSLMQVALQIGLHRPSHAQDFSRSRVQLREEDIHDRVRTWAACNVTAQMVSTGYGQPSNTIYDSTLAPQTSREDEVYILPEDLRIRVQIERFIDRITDSLYIAQGDSGNPEFNRARSTSCRILEFALLDHEQSMRASATAVDWVHYRAAGLHLRLYVFFEPSTTPSYQEGLSQLYVATSAYLDSLWALERANVSLVHAPNYIMQMTLAAAFALLKLMNSSFAGMAIPYDECRPLFVRTVSTVRQMSVKHNDLPQRLAEVVAQLWKRSVRDPEHSHPTNGDFALDQSLELKVTGRMSMSLVYDCVWRWREYMQAQSSATGSDPGNSLDVNHPTALDGGSGSSSESSKTNFTSGPGTVDPVLSSSMSIPREVPNAMAFASSTDFFDPLGWFLDMPGDNFGQTTYLMGESGF